MKGTCKEFVSSFFKSIFLLKYEKLLYGNEE